MTPESGENAYIHSFKRTLLELENEIQNLNALLSGIAAAHNMRISLFEPVKDESGAFTDLAWVEFYSAKQNAVKERKGKTLNEVYPGLAETGLIQHYFEIYQDKNATGRMDFYHEGHHLNGWFRSISFRFKDYLFVTWEDLSGEVVSENEGNGRHRRLLEAQAFGGIGNFYYDLTSGQVEWSAELYRIMGIPPGTPLDFESAVSVYVAEDREKLQKMTADALETNGRFELEARFHPKNSIEERHLLIQAKALTSDGKKAISGFVTDITDRKMAEAEMVEQSQLIKGISETSADILMIIDIPTKEILFESRHISTTLGYPDDLPEDSGPVDYFSLMHPDDLPRMYEHIDNMVTAEPGEVRTIHYRLLSQDGTYRIYSDRNTVFRRDENGVPIQKLGIAQDITDEQEAENKIQRLNQELLSKNRELASVNSELTTFNSIAANDYANTLKNLYTNLEFVLRKDAQQLSDTGKANMRKAQVSIQKLKMLTEDIVNFSRIPLMESEASQANLDDILKDVLQDMKDKIGEKQAKIKTSELPEITGFPMLLSLLFFHLIDNALKFNEGIPEISVSYDLISDEDSEYTGGNLAFHKISVSDNGIGFDPVDRERIFDIFQRLHDRKYKGSGIGLAVARKIMDLHGGFIRAVSDGTSGTTICCYFPHPDV